MRTRKVRPPSECIRKTHISTPGDRSRKARLDSIAFLFSWFSLLILILRIAGRSGRRAASSEDRLAGDVGDVPEVANLRDAFVAPIEPDEIGRAVARRRAEHRDRRHAVDPAGFRAQILEPSLLRVLREVLGCRPPAPLVARNDVKPGLLAEESAQGVPVARVEQVGVAA